MSLKEKLKGDVVVHMKAGNKIALTTVRNVLGEIEPKEKFGKTPVELDDLQAAPRENGAEIRNKQLTIDSPKVFLIDPV